MRIAGHEDRAALASVAAATFPLACPPWTTDTAKADFVARNLSIEAFARYLSDPSRAIHLIEDADGVAGYSMLIVGEPTDDDVRAVIQTRPTAELSKFYLLPRLHGSGAAARLMSATTRAAEGRGAASVWLGVNQHNVRANAFYERSGFELRGTKRFLVGDRWEDDFVREVLLTDLIEQS